MWHGRRATRAKPSKPLRLPPIWLLAALFGLFVALGLIVTRNDFAVGLFFPPVLLIAAALPPLWAVSWFTQPNAEGLTWRRGSLSFAGGATVGVIIAIILEILFPIFIFALVWGFADTALDDLERLVEALAGRDIATAITSPAFILAFVQLAIIAPLAEEIAKPLVTLPLLRHLTRREAFLVGAMAGAGFAALENVLYTGFGFDFWAGILILRSVGGAIHPLGAGLVALGWHDLLRGERNGGVNWVARFGIAAGMHALWNGGSLLVITLAGAEFFGDLPPEIDILGISAAGTTLALLIILGLIAFWLGRRIGAANIDVVEDVISVTPGMVSDRTIAIWALACLVVIVPAGITGLQLLLR